MSEQANQILTEEQMRKRLREKYPEHFGPAWTLFEFAQEVLGSFKGATNTPHDIAMWLIGGRAFKSYHSILNLCEIAYTEDAAVILRSLFNLLVIQRWISLEDTDARSKRYLGWFWAVMNEHLEQYRARISPELAERVQKEYQNHKPLFEYVDSEDKMRLRKKWHEPEAVTIEQMSEQVGFKNHYRELYRPLSSIEHSDASAYFAMVSGIEQKEGGPSLALHSDLFVPAYIRNAFQYFADILRMWNTAHRAFDEKQLDAIVKPAIEFFKKEVEVQI